MVEMSSGRFISLQRKFTTAIFLALTIVLLALHYFSFQHMMAVQETAILKNMARAKEVFHELLAQSATELFRLANQYEISRGDAPALLHLTEPSLLSGIESVVFFDDSGALLAGNQRSQLPSQEQLQYHASIIRQVAEQREPKSHVHCLDVCEQSVFVPLIAKNGDEIIANITRSLGIVIQDFYSLTSADIALVDMNNLDNKNHIVLASHAALRKEFIPNILQSLEQDRFSEQAHLFSLANDYYSSQLFKLNANTSSDISVLIYRQQSEIREFILHELRLTAITILFALLFSMTLISIILRPSLKKVLHISKIIRQLSDSNFDNARRDLAVIPLSPSWHDETDVLRESLNDVVNDLDTLNKRNTEHRKNLSLKISELTEAQRFNAMLLDTSPLIIMIHNLDGVISSINDFGRKLLGKDVKGKKVRDIIHRSYEGGSISDALRSLSVDEERHLQGEIPIFTQDKRKADILWMHRAISNQGEKCILSIGIDVTEQHESERNLRWLGEHDRVTGLLNRLSFIDEVGELELSSKENESWDLLLLDIDDFAKFNDRFGFALGDQLLLELGKHITLLLPDSSIIARIGSGEFSVLLRPSDITEGTDYRSLLDRLTRYVIATNIGDETVHISVVINTISMDEDFEIDETLSDCTAIMENVKQRARGQLFFINNDQKDRLSRNEKYLVKDLLRKALDEKRLLLFYQPIVDMRHKRISHYECLVRMLDEEGQIVAPFVFLGVAADLGLLPEIDFAVMEMAMHQQRRWAVKGIDLGLSINITAQTMESDGFEDSLNRLLADTGADPTKLIFEVVETDSLESINSANILLQKFRTIGAKIALDDFGVGFTSFEYVRELPVDYIKIDQSFVRFIHERPKDQLLVQSMVEMSRNLNKKVIVEGVENLEALNIVRAMGVDYVQGYYFSRPVSLDALDLNMNIERFL
ncbi:Cyclic di-GMP phosphodiesterase PdeR [Zhongshania aliphaticivorans]|uniref:Cyclic di-GMP phosphodiesterase PdeR n=1 Tax=Zhongshania aliphaticivorans TaxID=1470434 RepID=A0A5S9NIW4_9GAMM|nr:EAL domain-containing protein [Zhongshania aliphaticivorans]CAA0090546.1 Cyclic di-GMP phosphodiesterase PdeR [Zhongshania aliphaticivorans]